MGTSDERMRKALICRWSLIFSFPTLSINSQLEMHLIKFNHLMAVLGPWLANSSRGNGLPQLLLSPATAHAAKNIVDIDICCEGGLRQTSTTGPALSTFVRASWWFFLPVPLLSQVSVSMEHKGCTS